MKSFAKLSLLTLLCFTAVEAVTLQRAKAGSDPAGVTTPDASSIGIEFSPATSSGTSVDGTAGGSTEVTAEVIASNPAVAAAITTAVTSQAATLVAGASPTSPVPGVTVPPLSEAAASAVQAILTATTPEAAAAAVTAVAAEIASEVSLSAGTAAAVTEAAEALAALVLSPANLPEAIAAINTLIKSASRAELEALASSPTFMAIRQSIAAGQVPVFL